MVEGAPSPALFDDMRDHAVHVLKDLDSRDPKCLETALLQPNVPPLVPLRSIAAIVRFAVDLHCEPGLKAGEVHRIASLRELPAELVAGRSLAELLPEQDF